MRAGKDKAHQKKCTGILVGKIKVPDDYSPGDTLVQFDSYRDMIKARFICQPWAWQICGRGPRRQ